MSDLINKKFEKISKAKDLRRVADELSFVYDECSKIIFNNAKNKFYTYIPPKTYDDLKDCYSDGWLKVLLNREYYDATKSKEAVNWIGTVIFNSISNCMQRHTSIIKTGENYPDILVNYSFTTGDTELDIDLNKFYYEELDEKQKQIFALRFFEDMKVQDIAKQMNLSVGYISQNYNLILSNLKEFLKK